MSESTIDPAIAEHLSGTLDLDALAELQDLLEEDFVSLLQEFIDSSEQGSLELSQHIQQGASSELRRGAHSLKGSALNIGAPTLAGCWSALEEAAVQQAPADELQALLPPAQTELAKVVAALQEHFF